SRSPRPPHSNLAVFLIFFPPSADGLVARLQPISLLFKPFSNNLTASKRRFSRATKSRLTPRALPMQD
ncbi:MAG: hypothetical protein ACJ746_13875, partial [Bryobacteraceae bacterium]